MTTPVQQVGAVAPNALAATLAVTIAGTGAGNALVAIGAFFGTGPRTVTSNGTGTWAQVFDDASIHAMWVCLNPGTGTTQVNFNSAGAGHFTCYVAEIPGLKAAGLKDASASNGSVAAAWFSNPAVNPAYLNLAFGVAFQGNNGTTTNTPGAGYTAAAGTGITTGAVLNGNEGDSMAIQYGDFAAGAITATGTWSGSVTWNAFCATLERSTGGGGGAGGSSAMLGTGIGAC